MKRPSAAIAFLISLLVFIFSGCGGGTSGTDGGATLRLSGTVYDSHGIALSETLVTLEETGDTATTTAEGHYTLETTTVAEGHLLIERAGDKPFSARTKNIHFLEQKDLLSLDISVSIENGLAEVEDVSVVPVTPVPTRTTAPPIQNTSSTIQGQVVYLDDSPAVNATVSVVGDLERALSDKAGKFTLQFNDQPSEIRIKIVINKSQTIIRLKGLPREPVTIGIKVRLLIEQNQITAQSVEDIDTQVKYSVTRK